MTGVRGQTTDFFAVPHRQRAHRAFTDQTVSDDLVAIILDAAVRAPSAENRQPWEFLVVRDTTIRTALVDLAQRAWDGGGRTFAAARVDANLLADVDAGMRGGVAAAPVPWATSLVLNAVATLGTGNCRVGLLDCGLLTVT